MRELKIILIIIIGSIFACKKVETPPSSINNPIFGLTANLSGDSLKIAAGENDYYLFTSFETDANNVRSFVGTFAKIDCLDECQDTFRIKIRDAQILSQNGGNINDALFVGSYDFKNNNQPFTFEMDTTYSYVVTFDASTSMLPNVGNVTYDWEIGGEILPNFLPVFDYSVTNQPNESIEADLRINTSQGCVSSQELLLNFTTSGVQKACFTTITAQNSPAFTWLTANPQGQAPYTFLWSDGSTTSGVQADTIFYSVTVTDADSCVSVSSVSLNVQDGEIACQAAFSADAAVAFTIENDTTFSPVPPQLSTVIIEYIDENGTFYSSELENQPANAAFQILSVDDFDNNENGEKTKQLDIEFNCVLGSEAAVPPLQLTGGNGKIAVAYSD